MVRLVAMWQSAPRLSLSLIGPVVVEMNGSPVELKLRKTLALLAYLAVTDAPHSRDELAELLFSRRERDRGRADLRQLLSVLNASLAHRVVADRGSVRLDAGPGFRVDVREFRRLLAAAREAACAGDGAGADRMRTEAVALVRGEFMAGLYLRDSPGFEQWQEGQREDLRREHASALALLAASQEKLGNLPAAVEWARRRLALDPLEESRHRELMRLLAASGEKAVALRQYDRCRELLDRELGGRPGRETEELRQRIAAGRLGPEPVRGTGPGTTPPTRPERPPRRTGILPMPPTSFLGRERELAKIAELLGRPEVRLVTLTGPGGTGKTRLALEAARKLEKRFEHGAWLVDLAPVRESGHVAAAIASAIGVQEIQTGGRPLLEVLKDSLRGRQLLLVLDNCEHLLPAAGQVGGLIAACAKLKVLATSREPLRLLAEREVPVTPLELPREEAAADAVRATASVRLFAERAAAAVPDFEVDEGNASAVAGICQRLDGLPLAIELAATKVRMFTPRSLLERLENRLRVLRDGPRDLPARQQSLRSEIDWSHELLEEGEQRIFRRLSVFAGGWDAGSAEAVCRFESEPGVETLDVLAALVEKNLVQRADEGGNPRLRMLETIREYAGEKLEASGERDLVGRRFVTHLLTLAEEAEPKLYGPEQKEWFDRLEAEYGNLRAALAWLRERGPLEDGLRLAGALGWYWCRRGRISEGLEWLQRFREAATDAVPASVRAKVAYFQGWLQEMTGPGYAYDPVALHHFEESLRLSRQSGDLRGSALSLAYIGSSHETMHDRHIPLLEESLALARSTADPWTLAWCLQRSFAVLGNRQPNATGKGTLAEEALALARSTGDPFLVCHVLLASVPAQAVGIDETGCSPEGVIRAREALAVAREIDDRWCLLQALNSCGIGLARDGRFGEAKALLCEGLRMTVEHGASGYLHYMIGAFDWMARWEGRMKRATRLCAFAVARVLPDQVQPHPMVTGPLDLDEAMKEAEWAIGRAMTVEQAIAYALSDED